MLRALALLSYAMPLPSPTWQEIKTTREFERAVLLMFANACVFNPPDHLVYACSFLCHFYFPFAATDFMHACRHIAALEMKQDAERAVRQYCNTMTAMREPDAKGQRGKLFSTRAG